MTTTTTTTDEINWSAELPQIIANVYMDRLDSDCPSDDGNFTLADPDMIEAVMNGHFGVDVVYLLNCNDDGDVADFLSYDKDQVDELVGQLFEFSLAGMSVFSMYCMNEGCISLEVRLSKTKDLTTNITADLIEDIYRVLKHPVLKYPIEDAQS